MSGPHTVPKFLKNYVAARPPRLSAKQQDAAISDAKFISYCEGRQDEAIRHAHRYAPPASKTVLDLIGPGEWGAGDKTKIKRAGTIEYPKPPAQPQSPLLPSHPTHLAAPATPDDPPAAPPLPVESPSQQLEHDAPTPYMPRPHPHAGPAPQLAPVTLEDPDELRYREEIAQATELSMKTRQEDKFARWTARTKEEHEIELATLCSLNEAAAEKEQRARRGIEQEAEEADREAAAEVAREAAQPERIASKVKARRGAAIKPKSISESEARPDGDVDMGDGGAGGAEPVVRRGRGRPPGRRSAASANNLPSPSGSTTTLVDTASSPSSTVSIRRTRSCARAEAAEHNPEPAVRSSIKRRRDRSPSLECVVEITTHRVAATPAKKRRTNKKPEKPKLEKPKLEKPKLSNARNFHWADGGEYKP